MPDDDWLTAEELQADPILCELCGNEPADFHGVDGWVCAGCAEELHPSFEG